MPGRCATLTTCSRALSSRTRSSWLAARYTRPGTFMRPSRGISQRNGLTCRSFTLIRASPSHVEHHRGDPAPSFLLEARGVKRHGLQRKSLGVALGIVAARADEHLGPAFGVELHDL